MLLRCLGLALFAAVAGSGCSAGAAVITLQTTSFSTGWTSVANGIGCSGSFTAGPYMSSYIVNNTLIPCGVAETALVYSYGTNLAYTPSTQGAIASIGFSEIENDVTNYSGTAFGLVAVQGSSIYSAFMGDSYIDNMPTTNSGSIASCASLTNIYTGVADLNCTSTGSTIYFGFMRGNSSPGSGESGTVTVTTATSDVIITVTQAPEPATLALVVPALGFWRGSRRPLS